MPQSQIFNVANMSFEGILENKILANISSTVKPVLSGNSKIDKQRPESHVVS